MLLTVWQLRSLFVQTETYLALTGRNATTVRQGIVSSHSQGFRRCLSAAWPSHSLPFAGVGGRQGREGLIENVDPDDFDRVMQASTS